MDDDRARSATDPHPGQGAAGEQPLAGVRVLDFSRYVAGPYATMLLADAGAEVVKVEPLGGEVTRQLDPMLDGPTGKTSGYFHRFNRTKKSLCVDLRSPLGRDLIRRLAGSVDVVVENFRPGVLTAMGLGPDRLMREYPALVYCSISGYGHTDSPHRDDPAFAILAEVTTGVVGRGQRAEDPPVRLSAPLGDLFPAAMAVSGICMALLRRERTGRGGHIDMAMYDALVSLNENAIFMSATTGKEVLPTGALNYTAPFGVFQARDGFLCIAVLGEKVWQRFCRAIERPDLADDPDLCSGSLRAEALNGRLGQALEQWLSARDRDEAVRRLVDHGVPAGPVATPNLVINSPQTTARELLWDVPSYSGVTGRAVRSPIQITPGGFAEVTPVPAPGEHTVEVLRRIGGLPPEEIAQLQADGVVEQWQR